MIFNYQDYFSVRRQEMNISFKILHVTEKAYNLSSTAKDTASLIFFN